jgi:hypothetical protein
MSSKTICYGELHGYLISLGYRRRSAPTHVVYKKSGKKLPIILPKTSELDAVSPFHLAAVERILVLDEVVDAGRFAYLMGRFSTKRVSRKSTSKAGSIEAINVDTLPPKQPETIARKRAALLAKAAKDALSSRESVKIKRSS